MTPTLAANFRVPADLTERDQWVLWRYVTRSGKTTKVPFRPSGTCADTTNSSTWGTFEEVINVWSRFPGRYAGVGFVFTKRDPFAGLDLDRGLDEKGSVKPWAIGIVERFADSYMEVSPSGKGLKIWVRGSLPANLPGVPVSDGAIELYDHARYFAVTCRVFRGAPLEVEDHAADLLDLYERLTARRERPRPQSPLGGRILFGHQHNALVSVCGALRARAVCEEAIEACLQIVNAKQCEKPGSPQEISRIVRSSRRWGLL